MNLTKTVFKARSKSRLGAALALVLTVLAQGTASANHVSLSELIDHRGMVIRGDQRFSDFAYHHDGDMPAADDVQVLSFADQDGGVGLRFQANFSDQPDATSVRSDLLISYRVRSTSPLEPYLGSEVTTRTTDADEGTISLSKRVMTAQDSLLGVASLTPAMSGTHYDSIAFDQPSSELVVYSRLSLGAETSAVNVPFIDHVFRSVPEPSNSAAGPLRFTVWLLMRGRLAKKTRRT